MATVVGLGTVGTVVPLQSAAALAAPAVAITDDGRQSPEDKALADAKATGRQVELTSARTELSDTWVNPDGTFVVKRYGSPVRILRDGAWVPTDPTLAFATDGSVKPKATSVQVTFSGGGTGPILTGVKDGRTLSLSWPTALPKPTLNGNVATYAEVLPGVDLQLKAEVEGFSQLVVVKTAQAAANPQLATLKYTMSTVGVTVSTDPATGAVTATNPAGQTVFTSPSPVMWDSTTAGGGTVQAAKSLRSGPASAPAALAAEPAPAPGSAFEQPAGSKDAVMPTAVSGNQLQITPDQNLLKAADTTYPVYIDPSWAWGGRNNWTRVYKKYPNQSYWNSNEVARVGYEAESNGLSRSFFEMDTSNLRGAKVTKSTFRINNVWSWSCQDRVVQLYHTKAISKKTTWNNQPAQIDWLADVNDSKGWSGSSCPGGNLEFDLTWKMQRIAQAGDPSITLGMYAQNEGDTFAWKKFDPKSAVLETTYNNPPATPSGLGTNPRTDCATGGLIGNTTISLYAYVTDPNAGNLSAQFQVFREDGSQVTDSWIPGLRDRVTTLVVPDNLLPTGNYTWKVRAYDQSEYSGWSQTCKFSVDRTRPAKAPTISSSAYPNGDNGWPGTTGPARTPGSFTLAANGVSDVVTYRYFTDWDASVKMVTVQPGASATISLSAPGVGPHFVYAFSMDPAGNRSDTASYLFYAARSQARDSVGDLNGDGSRDIWSADASGTVMTYANQGSRTFSSRSNSGLTLSKPRTAASGDWGQDGYNDLLALEWDPVDKADKLWSYPNNGAGLALSGDRKPLQVGCPVASEEIGCLEGDDHWQGAEQLINAGDLNGDQKPDLLVKQGKQLWAYFGERDGFLDTHGAPVLVGGQDWDKYTVVTPGDLNGDNVPDLWLREANGNIRNAFGKPSTDGKLVVDLATWGTKLETGTVGTGVTPALYPELGSSGDLDGDGLPELWARKADNSVFAWTGQKIGSVVASFSGGFSVDGVTGSRLAPGAKLTSGQTHTSGVSTLTMQADGNLVLATRGKTVWASRTAGNAGAFAHMQPDGNLVVYSANGTTALWSTGTFGKPNAYAVLHSRGVLAVIDNAGRGQWTSGSQSRPDYNSDGYTDVLVRDGNGDMYVYPGTGGTGTSTLGTRYFIGNGWWRDHWTNAYTADMDNDGRTDIVGRTKDGNLWLYPGKGTTGIYSVGDPVLIGTGWNMYESLAFGDLTGDGKTDVLGRGTDGDLWVYPGTGGTGTSMLGSRVFSGNGWWPAYWDAIRIADMNGDYKVDLIGRTDQGDLYVFPNTSTPGTLSYGARYFNGNGWWRGEWNPFSTDLNSDGSPESVGVHVNGEMYDYLPAGRTLIGGGWGPLDVIL